MVDGGCLWGILLLASTILSAPSLNSDSTDTKVYVATSTNSFNTSTSSTARGSTVNNSTSSSGTKEDSDVGNFKGNSSDDTRCYCLAFKFLFNFPWSVSEIVRGMVKEYEEMYTEVILLLKTSTLILSKYQRLHTQSYLKNTDRASPACKVEIKILSCSCST